MRIAMLVVSAAVLAAQAVSAASLDDINVCNSGAGEDSIAACTRLIGDTETGKAMLARAYVNRALAFQRKTDLPRALADFDKSISLEPRSIVYAGRGRLYHFMGDEARDRRS